MELPPNTRTEIDQQNQIEKATLSGFFDAEIPAARLARTVLGYIFKDGIGGEADKQYRRGLQDTIAGVGPNPTKGGKISDFDRARRMSDDAAFYVFIERLTYAAAALTDTIPTSIVEDEERGDVEAYLELGEGVMCSTDLVIAALGGRGSG